MEMYIKVPTDLQIMCRTCMAVPKENLVFKNIFEDDRGTQIYDLIKNCTNLKLSVNDGLPQTICGSCYHFLSLFESFTLQTHNVDGILRELSDACKEDSNVCSVETDNYVFHMKPDITEEQVERRTSEKDYDKMNEESDMEVYVLPDNTEEEFITNNSMEVKKIENKASVLNDPEIRECHLCKRIFKDWLSLCLHFISHALVLENATKEENEIFLQYALCEQCGEVFDTSIQLAEHLITEHNDVEKKWKCSSCNILLTSDMDLIVHEAVCVKPNDIDKEDISENNFTCPICLHSFESNDKLQSHSLDHIINKVKCKACPRKFATDKASILHIRSTHPDFNRECKYCGKLFNKNNKLNLHVEVVHEHTTRNVCPVCGKCSRSFVAHHIHVRRHEEKEKKYLCTVCDYSTFGSYDLRTHMRTHTKERPYKCDFANCDKTFRTSSHRMMHMRGHLKIKKHVCNICNKTFGTGYGLRKHVMLHTGEKPFKCDFCDRGFIKRNQLTNHLKKHHSE